MNQAIRRLGGWLALPVLLAALLSLPTEARAAEWRGCTAALPVEVQLDGDIDETFTVTLQAEDGAPLPEQAQLRLAGGETGAFEGLSYTEPGDYVYTVRQTPGGTRYMAYDQAVYTVTVQVTAVPDGALSYQIFASRDDDPAAKAGAVQFLNRYEPPASPAQGPDSPAALGPKTGDRWPVLAPAVALAGASLALAALALTRRRSGARTRV